MNDHVVRLDSLVQVDPESLPLGTAPNYEFRYIDIASISGGRLRVPDLPITYKEAPSRARRKLKNGDVLMSTVRPNLKAFAHCNLPPDEFVASTGFAVLRPYRHSDGYFILQCILSDQVESQIQSYTVGSNYPAINSSDVKRLLVPDFSWQERAVIGDILKAIDCAIEKTESLIAKYQQIKAGLMHDMFTRGVTADGKLRPPREQAPELYHETPIGWIPKEWVFTSCAKVCEKIIDCKNRTPPETPDGYPVIRTPNVRNGEFVDNELLYTDAQSYVIWTARGKPLPGDIVITREAPVGEVCMIPDRHPEACLGQRMMLYRPNPAIINPEYFLFALQSRQIQNRLDLISGGSTVGHVRVGDIRDLWMFIPSSHSEQEKIAGALVMAGNKLKAEQQQCDKLRHQKHGLMHDLLTGRVQVKAS